MNTPFPNPLETTVASALLLLSTAPPSSPPLYPPKFCFRDGSLKEEIKGEDNESLVSTESKSSASSSLTSDGSSAEIRARQGRIFAVVAHFHDFGFQVARKSRSKFCVISDAWKINHGNAAAAAPSTSESGEVSCFSNTSSVASSRGGQSQPKRPIAPHKRNRKQVGSAHMRLRAQAILKLLSGGSSDELKIRRLLGDSPDTSKALRMLLKMEVVQRYGTGGRRDPYIYTVCAKHS